MLDLATYYKLLLGETNVITRRIHDISWTSDDARRMVTRTLREWGDFDVNEHDVATGISVCKAYLNELLRGLDKELTANQGWAVGNGLMSGLNGLFDTALNSFVSGFTGAVGASFADKANEIESLMNDIKRILNRF